MEKRNITIAVTGASGSIYARLLIERLFALDAVEQLTLIFSTNGEMVMLHEQGMEWFDPYQDRVKIVLNTDFCCSIASGSGHNQVLIIVPCSMGMMGRIASGYGNDLISRGADVMLKERRKLILVVRETPYNLIHIDNMKRVLEAGAVVLPASPSFYYRPQTVREVCMTVVNRILRQLDIPTDQVGWGEVE